MKSDIYDPFVFGFYSLDEVSVDANGCVTSMEGTTSGGRERVQLEFIYSSSENVQSSSIYSDYRDILKSYPDAAEYTLYDIDKDGYDELIVREYEHHYIYTYNGTTAQRCTDPYGYGDYYWNYWTDCLYAYDGNGLIVHDGGFGQYHLEYVYLYSLENGYLEIAGTLIDTEMHTSEDLYAYLKTYTPIANFLPVYNLSLLGG